MFPQIGQESYDQFGHFHSGSFAEATSLAGSERFVGGDGAHADAFMDTGKLRDAAAGFTQIRRNASIAHERRVREAGRLYSDVLMGRADPILLKEAMNPRNEFVLRHLWEQYPGLKPDL